MKTLKVCLGSIETVKDFVNTVTKLECDVDIVAGRYVVDAKSIMGIFSIDLSRPVEVRVQADGEELQRAEEILKAFEVKE